MTLEAGWRLLTITGLILLMGISLILPLHSVLASEQPRVLRETRREVAPATTVMATKAITALTTATPSTLTPTETLTSIPSATPVVIPTSAFAPTPESSETPEATLTPTPAATSTPMARPLPTPEAPSSPIAAIVRRVREQPLILGGCLFLVLLILGLLLVLWAFRSEEQHPSPAPPAPPTAPTTPHLEAISVQNGSRYFDLQPDGSTIGRATDNDLVITDGFPAWESVSRRHARIFQEASRWVVEDLDSLNGIYVNGRRTRRNLLRDGWELAVGGVEFVFHVGAGEEQQ